MLFPEQECVTDADLQQPGDCNKCRCHQGRKICSNLICIPGMYNVFHHQCRVGSLMLNRGLFFDSNEKSKKPIKMKLI